ncbi:anti-sigma factor family protein [Undibacterium arcticum]|uniref:Anti-sigma factor family protein n=1 Tax=Undibacterium arcticum TaxID=1762892 RepID=A0ABV7F9Q0_9BURK
MDCKQAGAVLAAHADRELPLDQTIALERHLEWCEACRRQYASLRTLGAGLRQYAIYHQAPPDLQSRIATALPPLPTRPDVERRPTRSIWHGHWFTFGSALAAMCAIALSAGLFLSRPTADDLLAEQVLSSHVRALMSNRPMDVVSSDQHTVKPWLSGKLDFSPAVVDLAAQGFPLQGGRLDYLDGRPVAALVYGRNQHRISVYVWPKPEHWPNVAYRKAAQQWSRQGYHLIHWENGNMSYWAISDAGMRDLENFAQLLRTHDEVAAKS